MIARSEFKPFVDGFEQAIFQGSSGLKPDLRKAAQKALKSIRETEDNLFILMNILEEAVD